MKYAVLLGKGRYPDELTGFLKEDGPRKDFIEVARRLDADVISYTSAAARRGGWFKRLFASRPLWGAAVEMALRISPYRRVYVTGEDIGFRLGLLLRARGCSDRLVTLVHNLTPAKAKVLRRIGHKPFAMFVTVCASQRQALIDAGVPAEKTLNVFLSVDDEYFSPREAPRSAEFMACGAENRDYPTLQQAVRTVEGEVMVFGHGFFGADTAGGAVTEAPPPNFKLMPRVSFEELRQYYAGAKAIVIPLNDVPYAAGTTGFIEAVCMGKPAIVTRSTGMEDYLSADPGFVIAPGDPVAMADAMRAALVSPDLAEIGARNRAWAVANCGLNGYVEKMVAAMRA